MYIADLHIHSKYSMATSKELDPWHLDKWARLKGICLLGTGDFTHPAWRKELAEALIPAEEGLYRLRENALAVDVYGEPIQPRFVLSGEISCIYKQDGKTRKVHNLILLPSLQAAEALSQRLEAVGNIRSDGRPILGLSSRDLLEITLESCPEAVFIPAHIWTPHFSMLGSFSAFSSVKDCFLDLAEHIHALETGLSSDPPMNYRVPALDKYTLVSNSDAHSPQKLGREGNLLDAPLSYSGLKAALETGRGFSGTLEFFPEEGKYHLDGHRACGVCLTPKETLALDLRCPVCGKKLTVGVEHRVESLAERPQGFVPQGARPFESLVPLEEVLSACLGQSAASKAVQARYYALLESLGDEFSILRSVPLESIEKKAGPAVSEGVRRLREGKVHKTAGFDGQFGKISVFLPGELQRFLGQTSFGLADVQAPQVKPHKGRAGGKKQPAAPLPDAAAPRLNDAQKMAAFYEGEALAVTAGPGTGKTGTLIARIEHLIRDRGVDPGHITAITFTNQAAEELRSRLESTLGSKGRGVHAQTFHALCLQLLPKKTLLGRESCLRLILSLPGVDAQSAPAYLETISRAKNGLCTLAPQEQAVFGAYQARLKDLGARDLDDLLLEALQEELAGDARFTHLCVDEYQDINALQRKLVLHFAKGAQSLFVIGDRDQSIYGFRGASAACFDELKAALPALRSVRLDRNYRSTPQILGAALRLIEQNGGETRSLAAAVPDGPAVRLIELEDEAAQARFLSEEIAEQTGGLDMHSAQGKYREKARAFSDIAVLCRTNRELLYIEEALRRADIPCFVAAREDYLLDETVQGLLGFFAALLDGDDLAAWTDCLRGLYGLGEEAARALAARLPEALEKAQTQLLPGETGPLLADREYFLPRLSKRPRELVEELCARHGLKSRAVDKLLGAAALHGDMEQLLSALHLGEEGDLRRLSAPGNSSGAVRLMTLHASKGLEFAVVLLAGLCKGTMPLERKDAPADEQEERRLLFVGMTRAREELILCAPEEESPFLKPLDGLVQRERPRRRPVPVKQLSFF